MKLLAAIILTSTALSAQAFGTPEAEAVRMVKENSTVKLVAPARTAAIQVNNVVSFTAKGNAHKGTTFVCVEYKLTDTATQPNPAVFAVNPTGFPVTFDPNATVSSLHKTCADYKKWVNLYPV